MTRRIFSKPRVALFTGAYNHVADGVSLTLNRLVSYLLERGIEVEVFAPTVSDPPLQAQGTLVPVTSVAIPGRREYRLALGLTSQAQRSLAAFQPSVVHLATPDLLGYQALLWAKGRRLPVTATFHTQYRSYLKYYGLQALESALWRYLRHFYNSCDSVAVPSNGIVNLLREQGVTTRLELWQRGVDTALFAPQRRSLPYRRSFGFRDHEPVILFVGRLVKEKGLEAFARVLEHLGASGVAHHSLVVGEGPLRATLERRLPDTQFTGRLSGEALARAYASSDIFLFPSDTETFGSVVLEAMASGLPVVAADVDAFKGLVKHGRTGYLAPAQHITELSRLVGHLATQPALRSAMGHHAVQDAKSLCWNHVLAQMLSHYHTLQNSYSLTPFTFSEATQ